MTWRRVSCVMGGCDDCGTSTVHGSEDETLPPRYDSIGNATADLTDLGWLATHDQRLICPTCQTRGTPWGPWHRRDAVHLPGGGGTWSGPVRHCRICGIADTDLPPPAPGHGAGRPPSPGRRP